MDALSWKPQCHPSIKEYGDCNAVYKPFLPDTYNAVFGAITMRLLGKALTFDDVLLVPAFSQVLPKDTSLATQFTRNIRLN
jgi:hypothetical protein